MFATLGGKIGAFAPARPSARSAERIIAYDATVPAAFRKPPRRAFVMDLCRGGRVGVFDFRVGHAS
jgi:hypothetical protein